MKQRIIYFSRIKALACIGVVFLHTFYAAAAFAKTKGEMAAMLTVRNLMMWAVPCFVMVSGALLLDGEREISYKKLFGRLILRMAAALVIFSVLFSCFDSLLITKDFGLKTFTRGFKQIIYGGGWRHMWYLYLMIAIYLLLPAYKLITKAAKPRDIIYLMAVYGVFLSVLPTIEGLSGKDLAFYICTSSVYPLFLFLGYTMHKEIIKLPLPLCLGFTLAGAAAVIWLSILSADSSSSPKIGALLGNYSFIVTVIFSVGIFGLLKGTDKKPLKVIDTIAAELEKCSFGIYLIHMAGLKLIFVVWKVDPFASGGALTITGISIGVLIASYIIVRLLKFIPYVNRII